MATRSAKSGIVGFLCSWHPLTAADNAGADGCRYGEGTTFLAVDCAGVVTTAAILRAFAGGARGVLVGACGRGDCHCANGNESCEKAVEEARTLLELSGVPGGRVKLDLSSDVSGERFAGIVREFEEELRALDDSDKPRAPRSKPGAARSRRKAAGRARQPARRAATKRR